MNLRKNEGFLTCIPCNPIAEYGQSNAPLVSYQLRHVLKCNCFSSNGKHCRNKNYCPGSLAKKCVETAYDLSYELSSCERNDVFSSMFRKISVSKQSISSAFMFLRMLRSCFITNIRYFFCFLRKISELCGKYRNYAEDADFSELCGSASPHPVRCHAVVIKTRVSLCSTTS